jgi:hypothetical protein
MRPVIVLCLLAIAVGRLTLTPLDETRSLLGSIAVLAVACLAAAGTLSLFGQVRLWWIRRAIRRMR